MKENIKNLWPLILMALGFILFFSKSACGQTFTQCELRDKYGVELMNYETSFQIEGHVLKICEDGVKFSENISYKMGSDDIITIGTGTGEYTFYSEDGFCYMVIYRPLMGAERRYYRAIKNQ